MSDLPLWLQLLPNSFRKLFLHRPKLIAIINNAGWLFIDKVFRMGVGVIVGVWLARYLGPSQFGLWNYSIAFTALFSVLSTLGLDGIVVRELIKTPEHEKSILGSAFLIKLVGGGLALLFSLIVILIVRTDETTTIWLVGIAAAGFIFQSVSVIDFYFQSKTKSKYTVYAANLGFLIASIFKVVLLLKQAPLISFAWVGLLEIILSMIFLVISYQFNKQEIRSWRFDTAIAKSLMKDSWPLIISSMAVMIYMRIDQIMIGEILDDKAVGLFSAALKLSEIWYFLPLIISNSFFPSLYEAKKNDVLRYRGLTQKILDLMFFISITVSIFFTFFSHFIITMLYGQSYADASIVLSIHIWASVFVFMGIAGSKWYLAENKQHLMFYRTLLGAFVNVGLNFILIPKYGINGAAISTVVSQAVASYLCDMSSKQTRELFYMKTKSFYLASLFKKLNDHHGHR